MNGLFLFYTVILMFFWVGGLFLWYTPEREGCFAYDFTQITLARVADEIDSLETMWPELVWGYSFDTALYSAKGGQIQGYDFESANKAVQEYYLRKEGVVSWAEGLMLTYADGHQEFRTD